MANGSLAHERGMVWLNNVMYFEDEMTKALARSRQVIPQLDPLTTGAAADAVVQSYIDSVAARCLGYRGFAKLVRGGSAPEQALMKAFSSESTQRLALTMAEVLGEVELGEEAGGFRSSDASWIQRYFQTFAGTISAGSSEVQRNIIAEKVLGLPRG
jgi:alkylation response protein AidB-like acyl-CoA dehydrogenase